MREIKFGAVVPTEDFPQAKAAAQLAEQLGFYSISFPDHLFPPFGPQGRATPRMECYTMLTALAVVTNRVRLVPSVTPIGLRHPALLAKMITTIDHLSNGRFIVGLGAGWMQEEFEAHGYPFPSNAERAAQLAEGVRVMKALWTQDEPTFEGKYFRLNKAVNYPKPVQKPHPPILIGGHSRRALRLIAEEANIANITSATEAEKAVATLHQYLKEAGRAPDDVEISGFLTALPAADQAQADAARTKLLGGGRDSAQDMLMGTPEEMIAEIHSRIEKVGMTFFILRIASLQDMELIGKRVIPEFTR